MVKYYYLDMVCGYLAIAIIGLIVAGFMYGVVFTIIKWIKDK